MTPTIRSLLAAAAIAFIASPAYAGCDIVNFPETHVSKDSNIEQLRAAGTTIQKGNAELEKFNQCIDKMAKEPLPKDATKDQIAAHEAEVSKTTDAYNKSLDNLQKAATEYNEAVKAYKARSKG